LSHGFGKKTSSKYLEEAGEFIEAQVFGFAIKEKKISKFF